jgi:F0F1-type ATP synthase alpha subunit
VAVADVGRFEAQLVRFLHQERQGLRNAISIQRELSPDLEQRLQETLQSFKAREWGAS